MKLFSVLSILLCLAAPAFAAPKSYTLQKSASSVGFSWFLGAEEVRGSMPVAKADIVLDLDRLQNSTVMVVVDVTRARAGFPFASQGMKSKQVLWANSHPHIIFKSTSFKRKGDRAVVKGTLTVRGVTRPATFSARVFRQAGTDAGDTSRLSVQLNGSLSRAAFGADGFADMAGDEIKLSIMAQMQRAG
ncbi:MAG: YceI family protein [Sedimentitalea sp.]